MGDCISIGPKIDAEGVKEFRGAINDILKSGADQATMQAALACLRDGVRVKGNSDYSTITNCMFSVNDGKTTKRKRPAAKKKAKS